MKYKELEKKSKKELEKMLGEERGTLYDLRLKLSVNQLKDMRAVRTAKKNIARLLTRINELDAAPQEEAVSETK